MRYSVSGEDGGWEGFVYPIGWFLVVASGQHDPREVFGLHTGHSSAVSASWSCTLAVSKVIRLYETRGWGSKKCTKLCFG